MKSFPTTLALLPLLAACHGAALEPGAGGGGGAEAGAGGESASAQGASGTASSSTTGDGGSGGAGEAEPPPAPGAGFADPLTSSLHDHGWAGIDWQHIHGWLLNPHAAPDVGDAAEMSRCVDRYAGYVTNDADQAHVSRPSVYAALAATGQCDADHDYDGALVSEELCASVHSDLTPSECAQKMQSSKSFGIATVASVLSKTTKQHQLDIPLMGALLSHGSVACGGADRWKLLAPTGFVDHYVAAYNAYRAASTSVPSCTKRLVVSVALYSGMGDPGANGVTASNGCWTYERISKTNAEWKICGYDGSVHHPDGVKWAFDDTSTDHVASTDTSRILACQSGVPGRGYVYMTNRGSGWPARVNTGVKAHFAELYSSQFTVDDQFGDWKSAGTPGQPMVNFGEPSTSASTIHSVTSSVCAQVADGGYFGVYVYPQSLDGDRLSAMVQALNACTQ